MKSIDTTLVIISDGLKQVLLIEKKKGHGKGYINFPGGKCLPQESLIECAIREVYEETYLSVDHLIEVGQLTFFYPDNLTHICTVFKCSSKTSEARESTEARPFWHPLNDLPYHKMWPSDRIWLNDFIAGVLFNYQFRYFKDNHFEIINQ